MLKKQRTRDKRFVQLMLEPLEDRVVPTNLLDIRNLSPIDDSSYHTAYPGFIHLGSDYGNATDAGKLLVAPVSGTVVFSGKYGEAYDHIVAIEARISDNAMLKHENGEDVIPSGDRTAVLFFGHLSATEVVKGDNITIGDPLGFVASETQGGPHVHVGILPGENDGVFGVQRIFTTPTGTKTHFPGRWPVARDLQHAAEVSSIMIDPPRTEEDWTRSFLSKSANHVPQIVDLPSRTPTPISSVTGRLWRFVAETSQSLQIQVKNLLDSAKGRIKGTLKVFNSVGQQLTVKSAFAATNNPQWTYADVVAGDEFFIELSESLYGPSNVLQLDQTDNEVIDPVEHQPPPRLHNDAPGHTLDTAKPVALDSSNKGDDISRIQPNDDVDTYKFVAQSTGTVDIEVIPQPGLITVATFFDSTKDADGDGQPDGVDSDVSDGADGMSNFRYGVIAGKTYYVRIESKDQASGGEYELHIRPFDPNDAPGDTATDRPPGPLPGWGGVNGVEIHLDSNGNGSSRWSIDDPGEVRWYEIHNAQPGNMLVEVRPVNEDLHPFVTAFRANGGGIDTDSGKFDDNAKVGFTVEAGEIIVVAVSSDDGRTTGGYTINVSQPDNLPDDDRPDFGENPDDISGSITPEGNGFITGRIETEDDDDWIKIPVRGSGYMHIEVTADNSGLIPFLELNRDGTSGGFFETDDGRDGRAHIAFLPSTSHVWAKVSSTDGTRGRYILRVWRSPGPNDDHPDSGGRFAAPHRLTGNGIVTISGTTEHPGDNDAFRIEADQPGPVSIQVVSLTEGFEPFMKNSALGYSNTDGGSGRGGRTYDTVDNVPADPDNWVHIDISSGGEQPFGDYLVIVRQSQSSQDKDADTVGIEASPIMLDGSGNGSLPGFPNGNEPSPALNFPGDKDVFQAIAASDRPITFTVSGIDSFLRIYDATGRAIATDHNSGPNGESQITLEAFRGDLYYLEVSAFDGQATGDYTVSVTQPTDDHVHTPIFVPKKGQTRDATEIPFGGYNVNNSAQISGRRLELTNGHWQVGSLWFDQLLSADQFTAKFDFDLSEPQGLGWGDGFTFAAIDAAQHDETAIGAIGGSLGYEGLSGFAIEFDTYISFDHGDPNRVHVGLNIDGETTSEVVSDPLPFDIRDAGPVTAEVEYDDGVITVSLSKSGVGKTTVLTGTVPVASRPNQMRFGFTGATASAAQVTRIDNVTISTGKHTIINESFDKSLFGSATGQIEIDLVGDRDVFQVTSPDRGQMTVSVNTTDDNLDTFLRVYDSRGNLVAIDDDSGNGRNSTATFVTFQDETYFIEVSGYADNSVGAYSVTVQTGPRDGALFVGTYDDFSDANLHDWKWNASTTANASITESTGSIRLLAQGNGANNEHNAASFSSRANVADSIQFDFTPQIGTEENAAWIELTDGTNYIRLRLEPGENGGTQLVVQNNGYVEVANAGSQAVTNGQTYHAKIANDGNEIAVSLDGVVVARYGGQIKPGSVLNSHVEAKRLPLYDDFNDNSIDSNRWNTTGEVREEGNRLHLWMYRNGGLRYSLATTANKPGGHDIVGFKLNSDRTPGTVGPGQAESEVSLTNGTDSIIIKWLNDVNNFVLRATGYYGSGDQHRWDPDEPGSAETPDGPLEIRQNGNAIDVLHNGSVVYTFNGKTIQPGSYFRAEAFGDVGSGGPLNRDYDITIDDLQLFTGVTRMAQLDIANIEGTLRLPDDPELNEYDIFDDNSIDFDKWYISGTVEEKGGRLFLPLFRDFEPIHGYVSTNGTETGTNLRGFKLNFNRTTEPKNISGWDLRTRFELTNGTDWIQFGRLHQQTFFIETGGSYGQHKVDISVPSDSIPDGPFEIRERDGNIEVLHNGNVKLTLENQTVRAGSYFVFQTDGNPDGQSTSNEPENFEASIDKLEFYYDPELPTLQVTPSLSEDKDSGISNADHITNTLSPTFEWEPGTEGTKYQWREGELKNNGSINYGSWSDATSDTSATVNLNGASTHVFSVRTISAGGLAGTESARAFIVDVTAPQAPTNLRLSPSDDPDGDRVTTNTTLTVQWDTAGDDHGIAGYEWRLDNGAWSNLQSAESATVSTAVGTHSFSVRAIDLAGNVGPATTFSFVVEIGAPPPPPPPGLAPTPVEYFAVGADAGGGPRVKVYDAQTGAARFDFFPYHPAITGGVRVATGDVNGDGVDDIITVPGPTGGPHIKVFDGRNGTELRNFLAYAPTVTVGLFVTSGDINGDGFHDIITGVDAGAGPHVRVFSGSNGSILREFMAYHPSFPGGVRVASGDINNDGFDDIITVAGPGGGPHVRVYSGRDHAILHDFMAYAPTVTVGLWIAAGDINGDGHDDVITGVGPGGGPHVQAFSGSSNASLLNFMAYSPNFTGGVRVATIDRDGDGRDDLVTVPQFGGGPHVRVRSGISLTDLDNFFAFEPTFNKGLFVG